jgi:hypothetical protein
MINVYTLAYDNPRSAARIPYMYGIRGLHEVIHMSAQWGFYDDLHLTRAARLLEPGFKYKSWDEDKMAASFGLREELGLT